MYNVIRDRWHVELNGQLYQDLDIGKCTQLLDTHYVRQTNQASGRCGHRAGSFDTTESTKRMDGSCWILRWNQQPNWVVSSA